MNLNLPQRVLLKLNPVIFEFELQIQLFLAIVDD